jgi:hypothetical protein
MRQASLFVLFRRAAIFVSLCTRQPYIPIHAFGLFVFFSSGKELFGGPFLTFTGNHTNINPVVVNNSQAWVHFTSDHLNGEREHKGFSLSYQVLYLGMISRGSVVGW